MISFTEHINEAKSKGVDHSLEAFEKLSNAKALPLKYVMFMKDESMREKTQVIFTTGEDLFSVTKKGKSFYHELYKTVSPNQAWNFAKLCNASDELSTKAAIHLTSIIKAESNKEKSWKEICDEFVDAMYKDKLQITPTEGEALEISKILLTSKKFGI